MATRMPQLRTDRPGRRGGADSGRQSRPFWIALALPGILWLAVLFIVPFYAVLAIGEGKLNKLFASPVAVYNPLHWSSANLVNVWHDIFGADSFAGPIVLRTIVYVAVASALCLIIGYPAAYFVSRFAGRRKGLFLLLLIAPFWISYMMRMLAWIDLLQTNGYVNKVLTSLHIVGTPVNWLGGHSVHGDPGPGLRLHPVPDPGPVRGAGPDRPLADRGRPRPRAQPVQDVRAGHAAAVAPAHPDRVADHGAADDRRLLHQPAAVRAPNTSMIGNLIQGQLSTPGLEGQGAILSLLLLLVLLVPMIYYVVATNRSSREAS